MDNKRIPVKSYSKNLVKTLGRILIFLLLPFVSFRFEKRDYRDEKNQRSNFDS